MTIENHVELVRRFQAGWWEDVWLIRVNGQLRVRKELHRPDAPWAREAFVKEWDYLRGLPEELHPPFVRVVGQCDDLLSDRPPSDRALWFDMEYLAGYTNVPTLLGEGRIGPADAERIQDLLIDALMNRLYRIPGDPFEPDRILWKVMQEVVDFATADADLAPYANAACWVINGVGCPRLRETIPAARYDERVRQPLENSPAVRLHGDLFYENVMYRPDPPSIGLIDPVSVAGVATGPVVFDRAKFHSWTTGELYALRHNRFELRADPAGSSPRVEYAWVRTDPVVRALREIDLSGRLLAAMDERIGPSDAAQAVLGAYFHLVMVPNTPMPQKLLRYARATEILARWG